MNTILNTPVMPTLFLSHGSPMLAIDKIKGAEYRELARDLPKPRAVLVFSAHWEDTHLVIGETRTHNELIYDFFGFPEQLYQLQYPAPGSEWLAEQIQSIFKNEFSIPVTARGLDHGVWVPFMHLWPDADVPVVQISMPHNYTNKALFELGKKLIPLREQGVLIIGSGMVTHNLGAWNPHYTGEPVAWAKTFDDWVKDILLKGDVDTLLNWENIAPDAKRNHPTPEHFRPLLIAAGAGGMKKISFPIEGFDAGILSTRSVQFG